jgi:hypothetical protein
MDERSLMGMSPEGRSRPPVAVPARDERNKRDEEEVGRRGPRGAGLPSFPCAPSGRLPGNHPMRGWSQRLGSGASGSRDWKDSGGLRRASRCPGWVVVGFEAGRGHRCTRSGRRGFCRVTSS